VLHLLVAGAGPSVRDEVETTPLLVGVWKGRSKTCLDAGEVGALLAASVRALGGDGGWLRNVRVRVNPMRACR
jgi:hypothetical protein